VPSSKGVSEGPMITAFLVVAVSGREEVMGELCGGRLTRS
jgi:hypothetical protein